MGQTKLGKGWEGEATITRRPPFYKKVENSEVLETTQYEHFNYDIRNRPITEEKVVFFMKLFNSGKCFMRDCPALVARDTLTLLDAQHRYEACKRLGIPFYFRFAMDITIENVIDIQINAGWKTLDYIHAFIQQKNQHYVVLQRFVNRYKMSVSVAALLLNQDNDSSLKRSGFYDGNFRVKDETLAHAHAKMINEIGTLALGLHRDRAFCVAIIKIMAHPDFDGDRMKTQMEKYSSLMRRHMTIDNYMRNLEDIYNYKLFTKNKVRFI